MILLYLQKIKNHSSKQFLANIKLQNWKFQLEINFEKLNFIILQIFIEIKLLSSIQNNFLNFLQRFGHVLADRECLQSAWLRSDGEQNGHGQEESAENSSQNGAWCFLNKIEQTNESSKRYGIILLILL